MNFIFNVIDLNSQNFTGQLILDNCLQSDWFVIQLLGLENRRLYPLVTTYSDLHCFYITEHVSEANYLQDSCDLLTVHLREFQTSFLQIDINLNPFFLNKSCHLSSLFLTLLVLLHKFLFNLDTESFELVRCIIFENTVVYVITFHENPFDNRDEFFYEYVRVIVHCRCLL